MSKREDLKYLIYLDLDYLDYLDFYKHTLTYDSSTDESSQRDQILHRTH